MRERTLNALLGRSLPSATDETVAANANVIENARCTHTVRFDSKVGEFDSLAGECALCGAIVR